MHELVPVLMTRRLSSIFDSCWRNEVSNFRLRKFAEVGPFCEPLEWRVDINNINSLDNSGSNETMQKVLSSIFDSCWKIEVCNFRLGQFAEVELVCEPNEPDVDNSNRNSLDNSGSRPYKRFSL